MNEEPVENTDEELFERGDLDDEEVEEEEELDGLDRDEYNHNRGA